MLAASPVRPVRRRLVQGYRRRSPARPGVTPGGGRQTHAAAPPTGR